MNTSPPASLAHLRLLICDDQLLVRTCVRQFLQRVPGIKVVWEAASGQAGVIMAIELQPDVVLMDVCMPDFDGVEATRQILAQAPATRVVAFTADSDAKTVRKMLAPGLVGICLRPTTRSSGSRRCTRFSPLRVWLTGEARSNLADRQSE
jgi:DNA-binding NarL/FixJ family response regulator